MNRPDDGEKQQGKGGSGISFSPSPIRVALENRFQSGHWYASAGTAIPTAAYNAHRQPQTGIIQGPVIKNRIVLDGDCWKNCLRVMDPQIRDLIDQSPGCFHVRQGHFVFIAPVKALNGS